ncbi:hypothetical protein BDB00DRAFT_897254 [Zychaea mexicana]|uniref:uncharacterized protein n=1 Tax=Zychaea mexicana TaxID=64656 RepID=UPI0022FE3DB1|nr:uncharacterized protein BDB00DRAFT_897254 [Zychaea mexicana]KAI9495584.1 hypothetical protein BDB00DRAFT_897254 [Zychaea mexicana]
MAHNSNSSCCIVACSILALLCTFLFLAEASPSWDDGGDSSSKKYNNKKKHEYSHRKDKDNNDYRRHYNYTNIDIKYIYYTEPAQTPTAISTENFPVVTDIETITSDQTFTETVTVGQATDFTIVDDGIDEMGDEIDAIDDEIDEIDGTSTSRAGLATDHCNWTGADNVTQTVRDIVLALQLSILLGFDKEYVRHFNAVIFGNYDTSSAQEIYGPLGIQGNYGGNDYTVNVRHASTCASLSTSSGLIDYSYGLVVGGVINVVNTKVHGASFLEEGGTTDQVTQLDNGCPKMTGTTGGVDFDALRTAYRLASRELASFPPNVVLDANDGLTVDTVSESAGTANYNVMTFASCTILSMDNTCNLYPGSMSSPDHMLYGIGNWNGPASSEQFPTDKTFVINVPVNDGDTITLRTNNPTQGGLLACNTIWNFYPVDANGNYDPNGSFTLRRETGGELHGLILAPLGHIKDSSTGSFVGQLIGLDYGWEGGNGVAVKDYAATGCGDHFTGCIPIIPNNADTSECTTTTTIDVISTIHDTATMTETSTETDFATVYTVSFSVVTETDIVPVTDTTTSTDTTTELTTTTETQGSIGTITEFAGTLTTTELSTITEETTETDISTTTQETTETTTDVKTTTDHDTLISVDLRTTTDMETITDRDTTTTTDHVTLISVDSKTTTATTTVYTDDDVLRATAPVTEALVRDYGIIDIVVTQQYTTTEYLPGMTTTEHDQETVYVTVGVPVPDGGRWFEDDDDDYHGGGDNGYYHHRGHPYRGGTSKNGWNRKKKQHIGAKKNKEYEGKKKEWYHKQKYNPGYNDYYK